jgi:hypothetical protein
MPTARASPHGDVGIRVPGTPERTAKAGTPSPRLTIRPCPSREHLGDQGENSYDTP